ncbi:Calmodulin-binding domain [Quillaja saponaria]|uniref:Calmodulin-binding domain n=1 Tax=Quillaja saponaria TaxID=32244 RepID=A0AAD7PZP5_QUISA|nr:Calmodulin-binding domain [Quillaja saponaria]
MSITKDSPCHKLDHGNRGGLQPRKNLKKVRSIKLSRLSSIRSSSRGTISQTDQLPILLSVETENSGQSTPNAMSDASPNYTKATSSSQNSARILTRRSSFISVKSLARISSMKPRRPSTRKLSGATEMKRKLNKSRSIKFGRLEGSRLSKRKVKIHYQASSFNSESILNSSAVQNKEESFGLNPHSASSGGISSRVITRKLSFKAVRILTKMATFKSKKPSIGKCTKTSQFSNSNICRGTCSSTLKDSKFPDQIDLQLGGNESERVPDMKVCHYTYCSLHGHRHDNLPPLKRFVSLRRRPSKMEKSIKMDGPLLRSKEPRNKRRNQSRLSVHQGDPSVCEKAHDSRAFSSKGKRGSRSSGGVPSGTNDEEHHEFANIAEVLLGETSYSYMNLEGHLHQNQGTLTEEEYNSVKFMATKKTSWECCCIKTEPDTSVPKASDTAEKNNKNVEFNGNYENVSHVLTDGQPELMDFPSPQFEEPGVNVVHSLETDDSVDISNEKVEADESVSEKISGANGGLKHSVYNNDLESENMSPDANDIITTTSSPPDKSEGQSSDVYVESTTHNTLIFSSSDSDPLEEQTRSKEHQNGYSEQDCGLQQAFPPYPESKAASTTDVESNKQSKNQKYLRMWHLMYKHAVSGVTEQSGKRHPYDGMHKEERVLDTQSLNGVDNFGSCLDCSEINQDIHMKRANIGQKNIEQYQIEAVKVVQEAFDDILLPEIQNESLNDPSVTSGIGKEQEPLQKSNGEIGVGSTSSASDFAKEEPWLEADNVGGDAEEKAEAKMGNKSNQMQNGWSNLKNIILLKKFVKALEKVRNINPHKPKTLPSKPDPEAEKVYLRHQTAEERKNAEEWMLDYALQQVISKLAPVQKQRVALLVEAFETVVPLPEIDSSPRCQAAVATQANTVRAVNVCLSQSEEEARKAKDNGNSNQTLVRELLDPNHILKKHKNYVGHCLTSEQHNPLNISELKEMSLLNCCTETENITRASEATDEDWWAGQSVASNLDNMKNNSILGANICLQEITNPSSCDKCSLRQDDNASSCYYKTPGNGKVQEVPQELVSKLNSEPSNSDSESSGRNFHTKNLITANGKQFNTLKSSILKNVARTMGVNSDISSAATCQPLEEPTASREEGIGKPNPAIWPTEAFPTLEESDSNSSTDAACESRLGDQKYTRLWYLVYKHMASSIAEKDETGPFHDRKEEVQPESNSSTKPGTNIFISSESVSMKDHDKNMDQQVAHHMEAIKLVEEAIDAILPDGKDQSPDGQTMTDSIVPEQKSLCKTLGEGGQPVISNFTSSDKDCFSDSNKTERKSSTELDQGEECQKFGNDSTHAEELIIKVGNKPNQHISRSWSNLKKLILLKRFIKALEEVGKFNPRGPRYLPLESGSEPEKVQLRHQDMGERKDTGEWMLDYALQQVVAKLTPARKRKVGLLVEAFETVIPTIKS